MGFHNISQTSLDLGLTFSSSFEPSNPDNHRRTTKNPSLNLGSFEPSLTLSLSGETYGGPVLVTPPDRLNITKACAEPEFDLVRQDSAASSFISNVSVKREREIGGEEADIERVSSRASDEDDDGTGNARKKLRLNKAQSALLEESFKEHSTLNPKQKQELARELKLRPRQVEVWFQNRRARTKLKQTEVDCEFLKKCCETLTEENRRLQKEVQELKALKISQPLYMQLPAATLTMCPSCERIAADNTSKTPYVITPKPAHLYNPFTNPSAAC